MFIVVYQLSIVIHLHSAFCSLKLYRKSCTKCPRREASGRRLVKMGQSFACSQGSSRDLCERAIEAGSVERMEEEGQYLWCKDCQMWINGPGQWEVHIGGKKHRKNARKNARVKICSGQPIQRLFMCALCGAHPTIGCCVLCGRRCCRGCVEGETVFECWACSGFSSPPENIDSVVAFDGSEGSRCHQHLQVSDKGQTAGPTLMKQMVEWISLSEESKPGAEQPSAGKLGGGSGNPLL